MSRILIVEDEPHILDELVDWLTFEGYEVSRAENGQVALALIAQALPDLILSDIRMPILDGQELLGIVRADARLNAVPFIFVTASIERGMIARSLDGGADEYLTKPFSHAEVMAAVRAGLQKRRSSGPQTPSTPDPR